MLTNTDCSTPQLWLLVQRQGQGLPKVLRSGICRSKFIGVCWWDAGRDLGAAHSRVIRELGADDRHFDIVVGHFQGALTHLKVDQVCAVMRAPCRSWLWSQEPHVLTHSTGYWLSSLLTWSALPCAACGGWSCSGLITC